MSKLHEVNVTRRSALALGLGSFSLLGLAACSDSGSDSSASDAAGSTSQVSIDKDAFDALIAAGAVASDDDVAASEWATKIKDAGTFRLGGVQTSTLFSQLDETDGRTRGFDAGLAQLLVRYILGDENSYDFTQVTSDTRETLLETDQVDAVFATYSINDDRKKVISFAGPYYTTQQSILVAASNEDINSVDDLAGKNVAVQSGSTGPEIVSEYAPDAIQQEFTTDEEARQALEQGRVDAYVIDNTMELSDIAKNPGAYRIAGDPFGPEDNYGIGLPLDSDGVEFVNTWLQSIEDDGTWAKLWQIAIGDRTDTAEAPEPPAIGA